MRSAIDSRVQPDPTPIEAVLAELDDSIQTLGHANREIVGVNNRYLARGAVEEWCTGCLEADGDQISSRGDRRGSKSTFAFYREHLAYTIMLGRYHAGQRYFLKEDSHQEVFDDIERQREEYIEDYGGGDPFRSKKAEAWLSSYSAQSSAYEQEVVIESRLNEYFDLAPENIFKFIDFLEDGDYDKIEYKPLLDFLAKNCFDPQESDCLRLRLEDSGDEPDLLRAPFMQALDLAIGSTDPAGDRARNLFANNPNIIEWLSFMGKRLGESTGEAELVLPTDILRVVSPEDWPTDLQELFSRYGELYVAVYRERVLKLLTPYRRDVLFGVVDGDMENISSRLDSKSTQSRPTKKRRQQGNGGNRTSSKSRVEKLTAQELLAAEPVITHIGRCPQIPGGHMIEGIGEVGRDGLHAAALTMLRAVGSARKYIESHRSDPDLGADVLRMTASLLEEPRGNGAAKMPDMDIKIVNGSGNGSHGKPLAVWRLNPNQRTGLSIGDTARDTRVYYVITTDKETGQQTLALLDVSHKSSANKLRGFWKKA